VTKGDDERMANFDQVEVAKDGRTIGWAQSYDSCCQSDAIPLVLSVYRSGKSIVHIRQGQMLWYWTFRDGGAHIAAVWGPTHGPEVGDYQLYDSTTGRMLSEVFGNTDTQALENDAPDWAKQTETAMHSRDTPVGK
jgi:hypothetical protein